MVFTVQPKCSFENQVFNSYINIAKCVLLSFNTMKYSSYTPSIVGTYAYSFELMVRIRLKD